MGKALRRSEEIASTYADKGIKERSAITRARRIVVKIGSTTVTDDKGVFNELFCGISLSNFAIQSEGRNSIGIFRCHGGWQGKLGDGKLHYNGKTSPAAVGQACS